MSNPSLISCKDLDSGLTSKIGLSTKSLSKAADTLCGMVGSGLSASPFSTGLRLSLRGGGRGGGSLSSSELSASSFISLSSCISEKSTVDEWANYNREVRSHLIYAKCSETGRISPRFGEYKLVYPDPPSNRAGKLLRAEPRNDKTRQDEMVESIDKDETIREQQDPDQENVVISNDFPVAENYNAAESIVDLSDFFKDT
ncbi:hypothetical protein HUJ04_003917 [Dendroctonus ponderosae]|nr:hypothetical protein HUJ04_003917 [Dendroctonus ponderosae]KAH1010658.1 hypothetical protein HUJ05_004916 [Dendroctonus ponderosae]